MRAPSFWWKPGRGLLLSPLGGIYGAAAWLRLQRGGRSAGVPVICLGNLTVGGGGKTPAALTVARLLLAAHRRPFFLSRGYGGRLARAGDGQPENSSRRAMSATNRCCWRGLLRPLWRATAPPARRPRASAGPASLSWTTAFKIRHCRKTFRFCSSTAGAASATAGFFRPARCGRRLKPSSHARRRS